MIELSGLELHKAAWLALGAEVRDCPMHASGGKCWVILDKGTPESFFIPNELHYREHHLPVVSEMMFVDWCKESGQFFSLSDSSLNGQFRLTLFTYEDNSHWSVYGSTPSEARERAIAAGEKRGA